MAIKIKCNRAVVDPQSKQRRACGHQFQVDDGMIGKVMRCPGCKQGIEIKVAGKPAQRPPRQPSAPVQQLAPLANKPAEAKIDPASASYQSIQVCEQCGKPVTGRTCQGCGHTQIRRSGKQINDIKPRPAGMQRWLIATLDQALPARYFVLMIHAGLLIIGTLVSFAVIIAMSNEALSALPGLAIMAVLLFLAVCYLAVVFKSYQFLLQPGAQVAWFQKPFWLLILFLARKQDWKDYDSSLAKREVTIVHDEDFSDEDLVDLDRYRYAHVLDLEGTRISDIGLESLYATKQLQCLVVRNTLVSRDEVYRFQQTFPHVWIWS